MPAILTRRLACGATLLVEPISGVGTAAVCWHLPAGLVHEPSDRLGLASLVSEMLMRGAGGRGSRELADAFDHAGASRDIDAGRRGMQIRSTMLGARLDEGLALLADTVLRPEMADASLPAARELSLQALDSLADDPRGRASIAASARHYPSPFDRSVYGRREDIASCTPGEVRAWWSRHAVPGGSVIGIAGAVDPERTAETLDRLLEGWSGVSAPVEPSGEPAAGTGHIEDVSAQVQIIALIGAPPASDRPAALRERIAADVLSGGMSGRLFTEVREKRGLCYAVSAGYRGDDRFGVLAAYVGTTPERAQESLEVLFGELSRIREPAGAVNESEFRRAIVGLKSGIVFQGESTSARASALVSDTLRLGRARTLDEIAAEIDTVSIESLNGYLASTPMGRVTIQTLGPTPLLPPALV